MSTLTDLFTSIAVAIRSKTGGAGTITASNFPSAISSIVTLAGGSADATATEANVLAGSTFYAQGVKKIGTLPERSHTPGTVYPTDGNGNFGVIIPERAVYPVGTILWYPAAAAGLTPEKILQGESILGVAGTETLSRAHAYTVRQYLKTFGVEHNHQIGNGYSTTVVDSLTVNPTTGAFSTSGGFTNTMNTINYQNFAGKIFHFQTNYIPLGASPYWNSANGVAVFPGSKVIAATLSLLKIVLADSSLYPSASIVGDEIRQDVK